MKKIWTLIKSKKPDYSGVSSLKQDGRLITDSKQKSNSLNDQFQSVFSEPVHITSSEIIHNNYMHYPRSKREVPRGVRNSKVRRQDKFRRDWSRHKNTC